MLLAETLQLKFQTTFDPTQYWGKLLLISIINVGNNSGQEFWEKSHNIHILGRARGRIFYENSYILEGTGVPYPYCQAGLLGHRYIKPCFLVLGLDFFHFNSCCGPGCPGCLEIYIY